MRRTWFISIEMWYQLPRVNFDEMLSLQVKLPTLEAGIGLYIEMGKIDKGVIIELVQKPLHYSAESTS
jgi:hypothetical protein